MAAFGASVVVGAVYALRIDSGLPSIVLHNHLRRAHERASRGELQSAQKEFRSASQLDPTDFAATMGYADMLAEQGDLAGELDVYLQGRAAQPLDPRMHAGVGITLLGLGRPAEALGSLKVAVDRDPNQWAARVALGDALRAVGRLPEAEAAYRRALQAAPYDARLVSKLGIVLALRGRRAEAEAAFREALRLEPGFTEAAVNLERLERLPLMALKP